MTGRDTFNSPTATSTALTLRAYAEMKGAEDPQGVAQRVFGEFKSSMASWSNNEAMFARVTELSESSSD